MVTLLSHGYMGVCRNSCPLREIMKNQYKFLPFDKKAKAYSPNGVRRLFVKALADEDNNYEAVFSERKYQSLTELWHASLLALAIKKWTGKKFYLLPADSPDVYFLDRKTINTDNQGGFPVEVSELLSVGNGHTENYQELAGRVWEKKGLKRYGDVHLLLVSRLNVRDFNVSEFARAMNEFEWQLERIWLSVFRKQERDWTFFEIFPRQEFKRIESISFSLRHDLSNFY